MNMKILGWYEFFRLENKSKKYICDLLYHYLLLRMQRGVLRAAWCGGGLAHIHREMRQLKGCWIARHISQPPPGSVCLPTRFYMGMQIKPVISLACFTLAKRIRTLSLKMETIASAFLLFVRLFSLKLYAGDQ